MRCAEPAMQEAEDCRKFGVFPHSIGNTYPSVEAGECSADECDQHGNRYNRRECKAVATKQLVSYDVCHITNWCARTESSGEASSCIVLVSAVDEEVRGEVFQQVEDDCLNDE